VTPPVAVVTHDEPPMGGYLPVIAILLGAAAIIAVIYAATAFPSSAPTTINISAAPDDGSAHMNISAAHRRHR